MGLLVASVTILFGAVVHAEDAELDSIVELGSGSARWAIPIALPPGPGGLVPQLALRYSSAWGDGPFGVGWDLALGEVRCSSRFGVPAYGYATCARFELDGQLLTRDGATHRYHPFVETFQRIEYSTSSESWQVTDLDGTIRRYGVVEDARVRVGSGIARWLLSEIEDPFGNRIFVRYDAATDPGLRYPASITYGAGASAGAGQRSVDFVYGELRPDPIHDFAGGIERRITRRLTEIVVSSYGEIVRRYAFGYDLEGVTYTTGRSRLGWVQVFGSDCAGDLADCDGLPRREFRYTDSSDDGSTAVFSKFTKDERYVVPFAGNWWVGATPVRIGDVDGDGLPDLVKGGYAFGVGANRTRVELNTGSGFVEDPAWTAALSGLAVARPRADFVQIEPDLSSGGGQEVFHFASVGIFDTRYSVVERPVDATPPAAMARPEARYSGGAYENFSSGAPQPGWIEGLGRLFLADVDADGLADIVVSVRLSGGDRVLRADGTPIPPDQVQPEPARVVQRVYRNSGDPGIGWIEDPELASGLPPFGLVQFESGYGAELDIPFGVESGWDLVTDPQQPRTDPCSVRGLNGLWAGWNIPPELVPDVCMNYVNLDPRFLDLNGDGFLDLMVLELDDPDALHQGFMDYARTAYDRGADAPPLPDNHATSVAWIQVPDAAPGQPRWVRAGDYDLPRVPFQTRDYGGHLDGGVTLPFAHSQPHLRAALSAPPNCPGPADMPNWEFCAPLSFNTQLGVHFADLNRDGLGDVIWSRYASSGSGLYPEFPLIAEGVFLNTGTGWCSSVAELAPFVESECADAAIYLPPENSYPSLPAEPSGFAFEDGFYTGTATGHLADLNADGFLDYVQAHTDRTYPGNKAWLFDPAGATASPPNPWIRDPRYDLDIDYGLIFQAYADALGFSILDVNGDGAADVVGDGLRDANGIAQPQAFVSRSMPSDLLRHVRNGMGGEVAIAYESAIRQRDASPDGLEVAALEHALETQEALDPDPDAIHVRWSARPVVSALRIAAPNRASDGARPDTPFGPPAIFRYAHPRADRASRSDLGFRVSQQTRPGGEVVTRFAFQAPGRAGRTSRLLVSDQGQDLHVHEEDWEIWPDVPDLLPGSIDHPEVHVARLASTRSMNLYPDGSRGAEHARTFVHDDVYGYGFVARTIETRPTGVSATLRTPASDPAHSIFGLVAEEKIFDRPDADMSDSDFLAGRSVVYERGRPASVTRQVKPRADAGPGVPRSMSLVYDGFGNLTKRIEHSPGGDRITDFCWDGDQSSPGDADWCPDTGQDSHSVRVGVMDALGGIVTSIPDRRTGALVERRSTYRDEPWHRIDLDPFGRPIASFVFDGTRWARTARTIHHDDLAPTVIERLLYPAPLASDTEAIWSAVVSDGFGGGWKTIRETPSGFVGVLTFHDPGGRRIRRSLPVACPDAFCSDLLGETEPAELETAFDALGRPTRLDHVHGFSAFSYAATTRSTGPGAPFVPFDRVLEKNGKGDLSARALDGDRIAWLDECGNTVAPDTGDLDSVDCTGPGLVRTHYEYEALGALAAIHDARAVPPFDDPRHVLRIHRDTLGRVVQVDDPALGGSGHTKATYDAFGNLSTSTNARSQLRVHTYDALNRLTGILTPAEETDYSIFYRANERRPRGDSSNDYQRTISYDALGRVEQEHLAIRDARGALRSFYTDFEYDLIGRPTEIVHPARHYTLFGRVDTIVRYEYDGAYLERVCELGTASDCDAAPVTFASDMRYDALGRLESYAMAQGVRSFRYDPDTRRLEEDRFVSSAYEYTRSYPAFDEIGNILEVSGSESVSPALDMDASYVYDERNRLSQWIASGSVHDYQYDDLGNLTRYEGATHFFDDPDQPYAIRLRELDGQITHAFYRDADGNVDAIYSASPRFQRFDSANRLVCLSESSASCDTRIVYDVAGRRVADYPSGGRAFNAYVGDSFVYSDAQVVVRASLEVELDGQRIALKRFNPELRSGASSAGLLSAPAAWLAGGVGGAGLVCLVGLALAGRSDRARARRLRAATATAAASTLLVPSSASSAISISMRGPEYSWEIADRMGTGLVMIDATGHRLRHQTFTPFGRIHDQVGVRMRTWFAGHRRDDSSGFYPMRARWYDPGTGQFLSVDPLVRSLDAAKSHNPYSYAENNPRNAIDPTGQLPILVPVVVGISYGAPIIAAGSLLGADAARTAADALEIGISIPTLLVSAAALGSHSIFLGLAEASGVSADAAGFAIRSTGATGVGLFGEGPGLRLDTGSDAANAMIQLATSFPKLLRSLFGTDSRSGPSTWSLPQPAGSASRASTSGSAEGMARSAANAVSTSGLAGASFSFGAGGSSAFAVISGVGVTTFPSGVIGYTYIIDCPCAPF